MSQDSLITYTDSLITVISEPEIPELFIVESADPNQPELETFQREPYIADWMVVTIVLMLGLLAWVKATAFGYIISLVQSSFNTHTANRLYRERVSNILHPSVRVDLLFYLVTGTFLVHIFYYFPHRFMGDGLLFMLANSFMVFIFLTGKYLLYQLTGFLFKTQSEISEFIFYSHIGNRVMGIFLLPLTIILFFIDGKTHLFTMLLGVLIMLFFSSISLFRGIGIIAKKDFSIYYLILYLCSLEILPLLIVWRILW